MYVDVQPYLYEYTTLEKCNELLALSGSANGMCVCLSGSCGCVDGNVKAKGRFAEG